MTTTLISQPEPSRRITATTTEVVVTRTTEVLLGDGHTRTDPSGVYRWVNNPRPASGNWNRLDQQGD